MSWPWSGSKPEGTVKEVATEGEVSVTSHRGNEIKKTADGPENPAVTIGRTGNNVVKKASELEVEEKANGGNAASDEKETHVEKAAAAPKGKANGKKATREAKSGGKRSAAAAAATDDKKDEANGDMAPAPKKAKGRGGKKTTGAASSTAKVKGARVTKKAATVTGEPRRSGRVAARSS